jgi:[ribosomal protein S18]-alanine N-acetyltransferase
LCDRSRVSIPTPSTQNLAPSTQVGMKIRAFADDDLVAVYAIQLKCPQAAQWRPEDYRHLAHDPGGTIVVAEHEGADLSEVAGFAAFHCVMEEAELRNIATDPAHQRRGVARALLAAGIRAMQEFGARKLFLEVRASNQPALAFYASIGFQLQYTRHDYYQDPVDDALVMSFTIAPSSDSPSTQRS